MNRLSLTKGALVRCLVAVLLLSSALQAIAQTPPSPSFQLNFVAAKATDVKLAFVKENETDSTYDFVVLQNDEELFRFSSINKAEETVQNFIFVDDQYKAVASLNGANNGFVNEIMDAFKDKNTAYLGILECSTKNGATSRLQIVKMVSEDEEAPLSDANTQNK